jgi:hypothetical protein
MLPGAMAVSGYRYYDVQRFIPRPSFEAYNNKILTSARNGDLIMWDLNRAGNAKYGA